MWIRRLPAAALASALALAPLLVRGDEPALERYLLDVPTAQGALADSQRLNEESHYPGSVGDRDMAIWMRDRLQSDGFTASIEPFTAEVRLYRHVGLELLGGRKPVELNVSETPIRQDPDGTRVDAGVPFNAWSPSGDVAASLIYAGRGLDGDYAVLAKDSVSVSGRIVLVRYGAQFRGALAARAQREGAAGVIFYSDPADRDGSANGPAYPDGPYRPLGSSQRGSVDPGLKIPALPVSADVGQRLLPTLAGPAAPPAMRGALDAPYNLGPSSAPVRVTVKETRKWITLWNTVGVLPGRDSAQQVIFGAHRDAWVYGVTDDGSGISTLLETARALGFLARGGWKPQRSIVVVGFDGEEIGELGSNTYVRVHQSELRRGCIAYVNADEVTTGQFFGADAAAAFDVLIPQLARRVDDPRDERRSLFDRWNSQTRGAAIATPGGGSDFEPFLYDLGIPTLEVGFEGPFGVYHSGFDDLRYATTQADPGFSNHRALAQFYGLLALRLADEPIPYRLAPYVPALRNAIAVVAARARTPGDLQPLSQAVDRLARAIARAERSGVNATAAIDAVRRLDLLLYGRSGYAAVALPGVSTALAAQNDAAVSAAVGQSVHALDGVSATLRTR